MVTNHQRKLKIVLRKLYNLAVINLVTGDAVTSYVTNFMYIRSILLKIMDTKRSLNYTSIEFTILLTPSNRGFIRNSKNFLLTDRSCKNRLTCSVIISRKRPRIRNKQDD
jgi:hypothetical protein